MGYAFIPQSVGKTGGTLTVTAPAGVTVTVTKDDKSKVKIAGMNGLAVFKGLTTGTWTVTITNGEENVSQQVVITADYDITMAFFMATINVTYPAGSTCTVTDGITTLTAPDTSGSYSFIVPKAGIWTVSCTNGSSNASATVEITTDGETKETALSYQVYIIKDGNVDVEKYPYKYTQQYWNSGTSSTGTKTGGVDDKYIKFEQDYEGNLAVWTEATNGNYQKNEFSNVVVPDSASVFYFQYYRLPVYKTAKIEVGEASVSVARDGASTASLYNNTVSIDITALRGQTVTFSYTTYGQSGHQDCYVGNAWFE